jgi:hypothetical protein
VAAEEVLSDSQLLMCVFGTAIPTLLAHRQDEFACCVKQAAEHSLCFTTWQLVFYHSPDAAVLNHFVMTSAA